MSQLRFVAWDKLDPLGTSVGDITDYISDKSVTIAFDAPGAGIFKINRNHAIAEDLPTRTYIKVHRETTATPAIAAFFLEEGADELVSVDEEGGEIWERGGRGPLVYLERAIIDHVQRTANAFTIDLDTAELVWTNKKVGRILKDLIEEAQARSANPLPDLSYSWTATLDSAGNTWDTVDDEFRLQIGLDLFAAVDVLRGQGLSVYMTPELELEAYQDYASTTRAVTFRKGVNIRESAQRGIHASPAKSRLLVQGNRASGNLLFRTVTDAGVEASEGVFEGFLKYSKTATITRLEKAGNRKLAALKRQSDGLTTIGVTVGDGTVGERGIGGFHYVPFVDYFPGDTVTVDIPGETGLENVQKMIDTVTLLETEAGEYDPAITFNLATFGGSFGETAPGGGKDFGGDDQTGGGGPAAPMEPAPTELVACVGPPTRTWIRRYRHGGASLEAQGELGGLILPYVGSWVFDNIAWSVSACPIGGGGWWGYEDRESWFEFTAPADDPDYLGLMVEIDATGAWTSGFVAGYHVGLAAGGADAGDYGTAARGIGSPGVGGIVSVYIPRSLVAWNAVNSIVLSPDWLCARSYFDCNEASYFGNPSQDGRGASGYYSNIQVGDICALKFTDTAEGLSGEVSPYGPVDGSNRIFTLIGWDGSGTPEVSINGLEQSYQGIVFNRTTRTMTLETAPPTGAIVLANYNVGALAEPVVLTPDPVAFVIVPGDIVVLEPIVLYPEPVLFVIQATTPTVTY